MGARFIIGRAGSGKTHHCLSHIVDALRTDPLGPPILYLLPRQATFLAERHLTCATGLPGFCRARVISFAELGTDLLKECGGAAIPEVKQLGRQMILGHLLRKHAADLRFFDQVAQHPGLAVKLDATLAELDRCCKDPSQLEILAKELAATSDADIDPLQAKLHDLLLIYHSYNAYVGQERLDPRRRMEQVLQSISASRQLRTATLYVDGFSDFDIFEQQVLARLAKTCREVQITLTLDPQSPALKSFTRLPHELSLFHRTETTFCRLMQAFTDEGIPVESPLILRQIHRFASPPLQKIEQHLLSDDPTPSHPVGAASAAAPNSAPSTQHSALSASQHSALPELLEAPDRRAEVDAAARRIRDYLAAGLRLRDIAVLVRQLDLYHDLINAAFTEHDIPYFVDRRRPMAHHPLLQFLRAVLAIAEHDWPHEPIMLLIKSGLAGLSADDADALENYVLEHHLRGSVWAREEPWAWRRTLTHTEEDSPTPEAGHPQRMDTLRRRVVTNLLPFLTKIREAQLPLRQIVIEIFQLFTRFGVRETLSTWIAQSRAAHQHEQAGEHEQAWAKLVELFDQMVDLLGSESVSLPDFREILESGLETFDLAIAPPTVDQVLVGQIDRTHTPPIKATLLLGMNEGVFPYAPRFGSILSDSERLELQKHHFDVEPGSERRLLDENLLAYIAFTRSSHYLYLSRSTSDDAGRPLGPSPYWRHLHHLFPHLTPTTLPHDQRTDPSLISTPRQLLTSLMRWARTNATINSGATGGLPASVLPRENSTGSKLPVAPSDCPNQGQHSPLSTQHSALSTASPAPIWPPLYHFLATYPTNNDPLDSLRSRAWKALAYDNTAMLTRPIAQSLFPQPLLASPSQIETFATCPFRHFLRYGLQLQPREENDLPTMDLEGVYHHILENIVRDMLRRRADWASLSPEQASLWVRTYAAMIGQSLRGEMMLSNARNRYLLSRIEKTLEQVLASQQAIAQHGQFRTAFGKLQFGSDDAAIPPLIVQTPNGHHVHLHGQIDRVDILEDQAAFTILDYRLHGGDIRLSHAYHGLSLQLLTYLLVLQANSQTLAGRPMTPAAAFYVRLLRQLERYDHPSEAPDPSDPSFVIDKQRGLFNTSYFHALDNTPDCVNSNVISARLKKDGSFGYKATTDIAEPEEFTALLDHVRHAIARLADQILDGAIDITPYRLGTTTPCPSCRYRSICRFDPAINRYRHIPPAKREEVLKRVVEEANHGA